MKALLFDMLDRLVWTLVYFMLAPAQSFYPLVLCEWVCMRPCLRVCVCVCVCVCAHAFVFVSGGGANTVAFAVFCVFCVSPHRVDLLVSPRSK